MATRKDLELEEKLSIPIGDLPLTEEVKKEYLKRGVYELRGLVKKFHKEPGVACLPFISTRAFVEGGYLVVKMGFDASNREYPMFVSNGVGLQWRYLDKKAKERINRYVNKEI